MVEKAWKNSRQSDDNLIVVGIGASAGGLDSFKRLFPLLNNGKQPIAYVVLQHLEPKHESHLHEHLTRFTDLKVNKIENGSKIEPRQVYVLPANKYVEIKDDTLVLKDPMLYRGLRFPIDNFFISLGMEKKSQSCGIILSGTGTDGAYGLSKLKECGGITVVQDPETCHFNGMPVNAIATGNADFVTSIDKIPGILDKVLTHPFIRKNEKSIVSGTRKCENSINNLIKKIELATGHNFSGYKKNTIERRIERRMAVNHFVIIGDYIDYTETHPEEIYELFREMLIGVTSFFRDNKAFDIIRKEILPKLSANINRKLRIWIPACSTGEEAYTHAILLTEFYKSRVRSFDFQIFASDIDTAALERARSGIFPESIAMQIPTEFLEKYFFHHDNHFRIIPAIREKILFSEHNIIKDPPYSKMDMISCRNFLIYLDSDFQKLVLQTLHYALNTGGYLFLGNSEGISSTPGLFNTVNKTWKIYEKTGNSKSNKTAGYRILQKKSGVQGNTAYKIPVNKNTLRNIAEEKILNDYSPTSIITNKEGEILYIHGKTGNYLEASTGEPTNNIVALAKEGLAIYLSSGLRKVKNIQEIVIFDDVKIEYEKNPIRLKITFEPVIDASTLQHLVLIVFEQKPVGEYKGSRRRSKKTKLEEYILELEKEVKSTREQLQNTIEELETSNEELKSSNEEVFSANEELQSANEELETSKEELQSANEELNSLNLELQSKIEELTRANEDLQNYISSTEIGVIFLTSDLRVSRYTPSVGRIIPLQDTDIGRPINNIGSFIDYNKLEKDAARVLNQGGIIENELRVKDSIYWMRMHPYLSLKNLPEGVVITFTDITERINASEKINFQSNLLDSVRQSVIATCSDKKIIYWNDYAQELYGWKCHEVIGKDIVNIIVAEEEVSKSKEIVNSIVEGGSWTGEILMKRKDGSIFPALVTDSPIYDTDGNFAGIIGISIDISERKAIENSLRENENKYKTLFEQSADGVMILREVFLDVNQQVCDILGYEKKEIIGMSPAAFSPEYQPDGERTDEKAEALIKSAMAGKAHSFRWEHKRKDGEIIQTQINLLRIEISGKFFLQGTMRDITDQVNYENKINESNKKLNEILESISDGFFTLDNNLVVDYFNNAAEKLLNTPREEVLNKKLFDTFKVARGSVFEKKYKWAIEYKAYTEFEAYFEPYGEWFSVRVYPFESGISVYFQIVTEQKKAQQSLVESEKRFKTLVKETSHLIWVTEPDGTVSAPQPGWEKFTGQSFEDYKHDKWIEAIHPDDREYSLKEWGKSVETRSIYQITHRLIRNDGQYRSMQVKAAPVFDSAGNVKEWIGMHTDITEKIEYEKRLKESQERFKSLFDNSLTGIFYINANGDILEANDKVIELLGSPSIEATRKINVLKFKPLEKIGYTKQFRECIDTGKTMIGEAQYTSKWGKSMFVKYYFNPIRDHENNIIGVLANLDDISGIKEAEERLKENKRFIERITATIPGIVHVVDLSTFRNVYTNKPLGTLAEYTPGEIESMGNEMLKTILHPDDFVRIPHLIGRCQNAKDGEVLETEYRLIKKNGEEIWVHEWLTPFSRAKEGKVKEFLGIALDHTIRKKYEKELRGREYLLNEFQQIGSMGGWEYSTEKKKFFFTEQARRILSINSAIPPSFKILAKLFHAESRDKFSKAFEKAVKLGKSFDIDVKFPSLDEGVKWIRVIGSPVKENGKIHIVRGTFTDVTERKRVEKQLIAARNKAVESDRLKSAFLANMSHEIRTPMNGILGFSELLKNKNLSEKKREYFINLINNSGNHLLKIINDIIDISKIESNQLEIQKEKFDIDHLCRELLDVFHTSKWLKEKKLELHYVPDKSGKSPVINSDPGRLRQIIINLVENALKYTEQGKVEFGYTIENRQVIFKVKDTGDGIPENKLNQIFSRFWQDQEVIKKALGGTGLGLSITKGLIELLGGRVRVKSKTGRGTEFTFSFKYEPDVSGVKDHVLTKYDDESKKLEGKTLLVAEDDEVSYYYLKEILEPMGLKLVHAANGEDAVKFCHDNKNIDVILMDIQMPLMDGFDALKEIKTFAPGIPVIAQTAYAMVNERDRCYKAGFDEYIAKPVNEQELIKLIRKVLV